jgi:hypothetical protein
METTVPAELLDLKKRLDEWRANRKYLREPMPAELQQAVSSVSRRYSGTLLRQVLKIDPWRLNRSMAKKPARSASPRKQQATFFKLPTDAVLPEPPSVSSSATDCRLQFERPDGARLTLTLPKLDLTSITRLAADFLRGDKQ